jgi:hypothetical protein
MNHKGFLFCKLKKKMNIITVQLENNFLLYWRFNFCLILVDCAHPKCDDTF